jgi:hypothetical protein
MPADIARYIAGWSEVGLDTRAFVFALGVAVLSGIISGLAPALQSSKPDLNETLKESAAGRPRAAHGSACAACWWSRNWLWRWCCWRARGGFEGAAGRAAALRSRARAQRADQSAG